MTGLPSEALAVTDPDAYTSDQLADGITAALRAGDMEATLAILRRLAIADPVRAGQILDAIELGIALRDTPAAPGVST